MLENETVKSVLADVRKPSYVSDIVHTLDTDSEGEPAVRVWVVVEDEAIEREELDEPLDQLREAIVQALRKAKVQGWPYVRFRERSEQEELVRIGYAFA